jgi:hypothetical protein
MRWGLALRALCVAAAAYSCGVASAQDVGEIDTTIEPASGSSSFWSSLFDTRIKKRRAFDFLSGGMPDRLMYFGGVDASHWSLGAYLGLQWAPAGLNKDGFILRFFLSENLERYTTGTRSDYTQISRAAILPGYLIRSGNLEVQLLAGLDMEADYFYHDQRRSRLRAMLGARGTMDVWWEPTRELMLQYAISGTTIDTGYTTRIAAGWRLFDLFWIGPEAALSNDYFSQQTRIGGHLTGLRTGPYEWSFAAGHVRDNFERQGVYARFGMVMRPPRTPFFEN